MLSLIEVTCPHCAAQGQIMLPPLGAIIIGPCPECHGMVAVFCGKVLALDKEIMTEGLTSEKRGHLNSVLGTFLQDRIDRLFSDEDVDEIVTFDHADEDADDDESNPHPERPAETGLGRIDVYGNTQVAPITSEELESFKNVDLRLLDNPDYFKAIFEGS
jgi:hypothetical protein